MISNGLLGFGELWPLVAAVGIQLQQFWISLEQGCHQQNAAIPVLDVGGMQNGKK
jgi:hypothetical protein